MTEADARKLISETFKVGWTAAQPTVDFALEDEGRTLPLAGAASFVHQSVVFTTSQQITQGAVGTRRVRRDGWIQIKVWAPGGAGSDHGAALADSARVVLEMVEMPSAVGGEGVTTLAGTTLPISKDARWSISLVRIPFWYSQTK